MKTFLTPLAFAAALAAAATPAVADSRAKVRKVIETSGLMGSWAQDCTRPPGPDNAWETFTVDAEGYVIDTDYEGTDGTAMYVTRASRKGRDVAFRLEMELGLPQLDMVYRLENGRQRSWSSRDPDEGNYLIRNGRWVGDDPQETRWLTKCAKGPFEP